MSKSLVFVFLFFIPGCSANRELARINDIAVPSKQDSGYRVVAIDGAAVVRASGEDATVVPLVLIAPGAHSFALQRTGEAPINIESTVEADKRYRIAVKKDGSAVLVEERTIKRATPKEPIRFPGPWGGQVAN